MVEHSTSIEVNPRVLVWARTTADYKVDEASRELGISERTLTEWESQESKISISTLRKMRSLYKRSLEVFLLANPPAERADPKYRLSKDQNSEDSKETKLIVREAKWLQDKATELSQRLDGEVRVDINKYNVSDSAAKVAESERRKVGISIKEQAEWRDEYQALREWIGVLEKRGMLIFQIAMPEGVQGFSLPDKSPPAIAINTSDFPKARVFTLFHEYGHILLGESGICNESDPTIMESFNSRSVETWCNKFAAAFMMPREALSVLSNKVGINENDITKESKRLKVSQEALLIRLYESNSIATAFFKEEIEKLHRIGIAQKKRRDAERKLREESNQKPMINPIKKARRERGANFIKLVMNNKNKGYITTKDAVDYLSVNAKRLDKLEATT